MKRILINISVTLPDVPGEHNVSILIIKQILSMHFATHQLNVYMLFIQCYLLLFNIEWFDDDADSLMLLRRGALLFLKVIRQISRSYGSKNRRIWSRLERFRTVTQLWIHQCYKMMHKAWSRIEEGPYCFSRSYLDLQGHTVLKIIEFDPNWAFLDCNSSLNSPVAMKWCTKLEVAQ